MKITIDKPLQLHLLGKRDNQEDNMFPPQGEARATSRVFVVCDGMGGHERGEVASDTVARAVGEELTRALAAGDVLGDDAVRDAVSKAHAALTAVAGTAAMPSAAAGTTLTLLALHAGGATVAHIGDSRVYHLRPATGEVLYWSRDHSVVMELWQLGEITREEMETSPRRNLITRAITAGGAPVAPDIVHITDVRPGDWFVLCTDGVLESVDERALLAILGDESDDVTRLERLVRATDGNSDNHTACCVRVAAVDDADDCAAGDEATVSFNVVNFLKSHHVEAADDVQVSADGEETSESAGDETEVETAPAVVDEPGEPASSATPIVLGVVAILLLLLIIYLLM